MCDERLWLDIQTHLPERFDLVHVPIPEGINTTAVVEKIAAKLPTEKVNLVGFSLGGYLAAAFALACSQRVKKMMIVSNMPCALPDAEIRERERIVSWVKCNGYKGVPIKRIQSLLSGFAERDNNIIEKMRAMDNTLGEHTLLQQLVSTTERKDLLADIPTLTMKTKFCIGDEDTLVDISTLRTVVDHPPHLSLEVFSKTGHMLPLEQPRLLAEHIVNWF